MTDYLEQFFKTYMGIRIDTDIGSNTHGRFSNVTGVQLCMLN
jgi:hypothetical protein